MTGEYKSIFGNVFSENSIGMMKDMSIIGSIGGSLTSMAGTYYATQAQKDALSYQEQQLNFEATVSDMNAALVESGIAESRDIIRKNIGATQMQDRERIEADRNRAAAGNVKVDTGSARERTEAQNLMSDLNAMSQRVSGEIKHKGMQQQASNLKVSASMSRGSASNLRATASSMSPALSFLTQTVSSAGQVAGVFYQQFKSEKR